MGAGTPSRYRTGGLDQRKAVVSQVPGGGPGGGISTACASPEGASSGPYRFRCGNRCAADRNGRIDLSGKLPVPIGHRQGWPTMWQEERLFKAWRTFASLLCTRREARDDCQFPSKTAARFPLCGQMRT